MAYDEGLAQRVPEALADRSDLTEKRMFGGLCFLLGGNMCCGIVGDELMPRVGPEAWRRAWPVRMPGKWTSPGARSAGCSTSASTDSPTTAT